MVNPWRAPPPLLHAATVAPTGAATEPLRLQREAALTLSPVSTIVTPPGSRSPARPLAERRNRCRGKGGNVVVVVVMVVVVGSSR